MKRSVLTSACGAMGSLLPVYGWDGGARCELARCSAKVAACLDWLTGFPLASPQSPFKLCDARSHLDL